MLKHLSNVLVTGVTGLIGGEFVRRLLDTDVGSVYCLIRPKAGSDARTRLKERLRRSGDARGDDPRLRAIAGDVTQERFGMSDVDYADVTRSVDVVVHCASELSFIRDRNCRQTNIVGMHNLVQLVRSCRRHPPVVHLGTVASCGAVSHRCMSEDDGSNPDSEHHNEYTRTKAVAERVLRDSGLPALVLRPSITLSAGVPARKFARAIAWFVPLLREFAAIPIDPASRVDVVPVSFVVDAMMGLLRKPSLRYDCYNLSAGVEHAMICGHVSQFLDGFYERTRPLEMVAPVEWSREKHRQHVGTRELRRLFSTLKYYLPFLNMDVVYSNQRLREELGDSMPEITPVQRYLGVLLNLVGEQQPSHLATS